MTKEELALKFLEETKIKGTRKLSKEQEFLESVKNVIEKLIEKDNKIKLTTMANILNKKEIKENFEKEIKTYHIKSFLERHPELKELLSKKDK